MTGQRKPQRFGRAVALVLLAVGAAIVPLSPAWVERNFSRGIYPAVQRMATRCSNLLPVALLDITIACALIALTAVFVRTARARGWRPAAGRVAILLLEIAAVTYLAFLALWGLNYRRVPLEEKLDFDRTRVNEQQAFVLASEAVGRVNDLHAAAHAGAFDPARLWPAFAAAERALGSERRITPGRPKQSVLAFYFRAAAIDGMTDPLFLEVILNPDLLPFEQPEVLAHEWGHLAGYADESEASFLAWLACLRGDRLAQYSGWLSAYRRATNALPRSVRSGLPRLGDGPRADLEAIFARQAHSSKLVRSAARGAYDSYLKANRIREGIENYDEVIQLMLGTSLGNEWSPAK